MKKSLHNHLTCKDKECKWHSESPQETSLKELDYKIKHKENCMHKDCKKEVNCLCDCPRPSLKKCCENCYASKDNMGYLPICIDKNCPCHTSSNEENGYEKKHCPNCKLDFLGIGFDSECPECETKFIAPSLEWEFDEDMLKNGNDGDTREWKIRQEQIEKEVKSFIHKVESNALARGREETLKEMEEKIEKLKKRQTLHYAGGIIVEHHRGNNCGSECILEGKEQGGEFNFVLNQVLQALKDKPK